MNNSSQPYRTTRTGANKRVGQVVPQKGKAAEHSRTPKSVGFRSDYELRKVLECGCALPLSLDVHRLTGGFIAPYENYDSYQLQDNKLDSQEKHRETLMYGLSCITLKLTNT